MPYGSRVDMERITGELDGEDIGIFQTFSGGAVTSTDTKNRPGNMGDEESLGAPKSRDAFTIGRVYDLERDHPKFKLWDALCGEGQITVVRQKLDRKRNPVGDPITYTGTLMKVSAPDTDSNAAARAEFTLEVSANEAIS
jgi:hypothetical protein